MLVLMNFSWKCDSYNTSWCNWKLYQKLVIKWIVCICAEIHRSCRIFNNKKYMENISNHRRLCKHNKCYYTGSINKVKTYKKNSTRYKTLWVDKRLSGTQHEIFGQCDRCVPKNLNVMNFFLEYYMNLRSSFLKVNTCPWLTDYFCRSLNSIESDWFGTANKQYFKWISVDGHW